MLLVGTVHTAELVRLFGSQVEVTGMEQSLFRWLGLENIYKFLLVFKS